MVAADSRSCRRTGSRRGIGIGAGAFDEAVGQEGAGHGVVELGHFLLAYQSGLAQGGPNLVAKCAILWAVGAAVVVELDVEAGEILDVGLAHLGDERLLADPLGAARIMIAVPWVSSAHM